MEARLGVRLGIAGQRGFWLRCFLGAALAAPGACPVVHAQLDLPRAIHVVHLHGVVVNPKGQPVAGADVSLVKDDRVAYATHTDAAGRFDFEHAEGHYVFRVKTPGYAEAARDVVVEFEISALGRKQLYVVLGPGACSDDCSSVLTSKKEFQQIIRRNTRHSY
ncbi:carboxypeptidase regulatory-like domain-containing protein [Acidobacteria bacterium AB60]|nr:carboxypeptidase regulatory-like domain-containing protein [Acidobacteria bacterium AB60]